MRSIEAKTRNRIATGLAITIGTFGVAACGAEEKKDEGQKQTINQMPATDADNAPRDSETEIATEYFSDGTRIITYKRDNNHDLELNAVYGFCDGPDLVEQIDWAGAISRSVNHAACEDGRLTPGDFELPVAKTLEK